MNSYTDTRKNYYFPKITNKAKENMTGKDFGKVTPFDTEKMAYDITGVPKKKEEVIYPTGVATRVGALFEEPALKTKVEQENAPKVKVVTDAKDVKVEATPNTQVKVVTDAHVDPSEAIGLKKID